MSAKKKDKEKDDLIKEKDTRINQLMRDLKHLEKEVVDQRTIRREIFKLPESKCILPKWCIDKTYKELKSTPGTPVLQCSDWHGGEMVNKKEIYGVNEFNLAIMDYRIEKLISTTVNLLKHNVQFTPNYPGIIMTLQGDMISGDIHEELRETNELPSIPTLLHMSNMLIKSIDTLAKEFGKVLVPCVTGNHGRNTLKIRAKQRSYTSYDWLLYQMLESHYKDNENVTILTTLSPDILFSVWNTTFLATHGDTLGKGGDGIIGCVGPIIRGDQKTRARNAQISMDYDILLLGHFHQSIWHSRFISNGSLIGANEYSLNILRAPYEPPQQNLFLVHPEIGINYQMKIIVEKQDNDNKRSTEWVSWQKYI